MKCQQLALVDATEGNRNRGRVQKVAKHTFVDMPLIEAPEMGGRGKVDDWTEHVMGKHKSEEFLRRISSAIVVVNSNTMQNKK